MACTYMTMPYAGEQWIATERYKPEPQPLTPIPSWVSTAMASPPGQPVPFQDFEFPYDPSLQGYYPAPPAQSPHPTQLFSQSETTNLLGFLDNFNRDIDPSLSNEGSSQQRITNGGSHPPPYSQEYAPPPLPDRSVHVLPRKDNGYMDTTGDYSYGPNSPPTTAGSSSGRVARPSNIRSLSTTSIPNASSSNLSSKSSLSTPQKRINHIMSEQKRRNAIREGYSVLISLLAPGGGGITIEMPTRGRPKGSGARNKGRTRGKSGILFRAVEFCNWLEEGNQALREEIERVEKAAGLRPL